MAWTYQQSTGRFYDPSGMLVDIGYSGGDCGKRPDGVNNSDLENVMDVGPIVRGNYTADQLIQHDPKLGHYVIHLLPDDATRKKILSYGRGPNSFYNHGDLISAIGKREASDGCIILLINTRISFWTSSDHGLEVIR